MARHATSEEMPVTLPGGRWTPTQLIILAAVLVVGAVTVSLVVAGQPDDAQGFIGASMFFGLVALLTRRWWR